MGQEALSAGKAISGALANNAFKVGSAGF